MPAMETVRVKKVGLGRYRITGRAGREVKLQPKDVLKHQKDPIGVEFDVMVMAHSPTNRVTRRGKK